MQDPATGESVSLFDLLPAGWTLLLLPGDTATPETVARLERLAEQTRATVGDAVQTYLVLSASAAREPSGAGVARSGRRDRDRMFGARDGLVALVRPDGYLGYRGRPDQPGELASYLARVFAMRMPGVENGNAETK